LLLASLTKPASSEFSKRPLLKKYGGERLRKTLNISFRNPHMCTSMGTRLGHTTHPCAHTGRTKKGRVDCSYLNKVVYLKSSGSTE
jgi:3-methyladenine DNA glycosylase AlkC